MVSPSKQKQPTHPSNPPNVSAHVNDVDDPVVDPHFMNYFKNITRPFKNLMTDTSQPNLGTADWAGLRETRIDTETSSMYQIRK